MAAPNIVIDGTHVYGSYTETINGTAYILDEVKITRPVEEATDMLTTGLPGRARYTAGRAELTATLQIPAAGTRPKFGDTFTETFDNNYGAETWILMQVDFEASSAPTEIRKMPVTFKKQYSSPLTTV